MTANVLSTDQSLEMTEDYSTTDSTGTDKLMDDMVKKELMSLNITNEKELDCLLNFLEQPYPPLPVPEDVDPISAFCNSTWDGVSCWPTTLAGTTTVIPCFDELGGVTYDTTRKFLSDFNPLSHEFASFIASSASSGGFDSRVLWLLLLPVSLLFSFINEYKALLSSDKMDCPVTSSESLNNSVCPSRPGIVVAVH